MLKPFSPFRLPRPFGAQGSYGPYVPPGPSYGVTGPSTGVALAESTNFTVTGANLTGPVIVTPASDDPGGSFTPATVTIDVGDVVKTFTYTPDGSIGIHTISFTNNGGLANPAALEYDVTAVPGASLEFTGPASGTVGFESTDFTVTITNPPAGDTIITFVSSGSGDSFSIATRTLNSGALSATVKVTAGNSGARNISITNDRSISNPAAVAYTASDPAYVSGFRTYAAGDIPPGLLPEQYDGIAYLYEPHPQALTFV